MLVESCLSGIELPWWKTGHSVRLAWPQVAVPLRSKRISTYQPFGRPESTLCRPSRRSEWRTLVESRLSGFK